MTLTNQVLRDPGLAWPSLSILWGAVFLLPNSEPRALGHSLFLCVICEYPS